MNALTGKYQIKNTANGSYADVQSRFNGLCILKVDGLIDKGKAVNIYTAQWIDSQTEDFLITKTVNNAPVVIRENVDIEVTFIIRAKYHSDYGSSGFAGLDVEALHDSFINYMTGSDVWIKSLYVDKAVHCVCLKEYKPTAVKLHRGDDSYIMGTLTLHTLSEPTNA